jgi:hypothetical protein
MHLTAHGGQVVAKVATIGVKVVPVAVAALELDALVAKVAMHAVKVHLEAAGAEVGPDAPEARVAMRGVRVPPTARRVKTGGRSSSTSTAMGSRLQNTRTPPSS